MKNYIHVFFFLNNDSIPYKMHCILYSDSISSTVQATSLQKISRRPIGCDLSFCKKCDFGCPTRYRSY